MCLHLKCIEILLTLDVEFTISAALELESDDNPSILGDKVRKNRKVESKRLNRLNEPVQIAPQ